jgi:RNA polymerase sigma-70 factor (ECF subfamily)
MQVEERIGALLVAGDLRAAAALEEDDRALLVLRVDRGMGWNDIARIHSADDVSSETVARVGARLRKRFQLVKEEIRARAQEAGLLADEEP